jgi:hypothetical protein
LWELNTTMIKPRKLSEFAHKNHSCKECTEVFTLPRLLYKHIQKEHSSLEEYHEIYYGKTFCANCGKDTKFISILLGYNEHCSRSCSASTFRKNLKTDEVRYKKFVETTANVVSEIWKNRTPEESLEIRLKVGATRKNTVSKMSVEERRLKFDWVNKLSGEARDIAIRKITQHNLRPSKDKLKTTPHKQHKMNEAICKFFNLDPTLIDKEFLELYEIE